MFAIFLYFMGIVIWGVVWGIATDTVINNKGYTENWFWWGFFFGFIALIVACTKPENRSYTSSESNYEMSSNFSNYPKYSSSTTPKMNPGDWKCTCGRVNASYVSSCTCGKTKRDIEAENARIEEEKKAENLAEQEVAAKKKYRVKPIELLH